MKRTDSQGKRLGIGVMSPLPHLNQQGKEKAVMCAYVLDGVTGRAAEFSSS